MWQLAILLIAPVLSAPVSAQPNSTVDRVARYIQRGDAHRAVGDTVSALAFYRDAIAVAPRRSEGYAALGAMYLEIGEPARALEVYEAGVASAHGGEALWLGYARTLEKLGQPGRALDALRRWLEVEPRSRGGLRALADAAERRGAFAEALAARRALLDQLAESGARSGESGELARETASERAQVRALERILGAAERVRSREACEAEEPSNVARALARCP
jgi:tetratricopeptide (TPR) repeat protein